MVKIDLRDRKILHELSKNCRQSSISIAKKIGLRREIVDYRIKKLIEKKIIFDFITEIDETKLGFNRYLIHIVFQHVTTPTPRSPTSDFC